jgi:tRNA U34 2-thiouridine synthase MnmA/TrmU
MVKAISLLSGGLDSTLATILVSRQGVQVTAVKFLTAFGCDAGEGGSCGFDASAVASRFGFQLKLCPMGQEYVDMVRKPAHGRGKNMNPCVDCRIMMLSWAKEYLTPGEDDFLITGEVLDQRPMSQNRMMMDEVIEESGLRGMVLRPLSAKLLEPTIPEQRGWVDREKLEGISGRSRKRQIELAREFGLGEGDYGQPAGGCLLTDPGYSHRLRDLWDNEPNAGISDITLLKFGRHFRLDRAAKIIVGRNESENDAIEGLSRRGDVIVKPKDVPGPSVMLRGAFTESALPVVMGLTRKYSDGHGPGPVIILKIDASSVDESERLVSQEDIDRAVASSTHITL